MEAVIRWLLAFFILTVAIDPALAQSTVKKSKKKSSSARKERVLKERKQRPEKSSSKDSARPETTGEDADGVATTSSGSSARGRTSQLRVNFSLWHESLEMDKGSDRVKAEMQSTGIVLGYGRYRPSSVRWGWYYGAEAGLGTIKGKAISNSLINDGLSNQFWYLAGLNTGFIYRTTRVSEVGLFLPVWYRLIKWEVNPGSQLDPQRDSSFSAGIQGQMIQRFSNDSALQLAMTYQYMWQATVWTIAWMMDFH